tara:strand:+ start:357 stop:869 length:513 start_codon:yes stop_codon:yes gene_type:complete
VVRERIKEIVDFASSESPYSAANKGWINEDIYIQWGKSTKQKNNSANELVNVSVFWNPIQILISIIFGVLLISTIFVFSVVSLSNGRFDFSVLKLLNGLETIQRVPETSFDAIEDSQVSIQDEQIEEIEVTSAINTSTSDLNPLPQEEAEVQVPPKNPVETGNMLQPRKK